MRSSAMPHLLLVLIGTVSFILFSGQLLPPVVASHFAAGGNADGFMPRNGYLVLMAPISVGIPLLVALCNGLLRFVPPSMVNLPNRDYWLAPERKEETYAFLRNHCIYLAVLVALFLCFVHCLVLQANALEPPQLLLPLFIPGSVCFLLAVCVWIAVLFAHFVRRPQHW
jgi:hypothetical protein